MSRWASPLQAVEMVFMLWLLIKGAKPPANSEPLSSTMVSMRTFSARETEWLLELDGIELASFWRRALAFLLDWIVVSILLSLLVGGAAAIYLKARERQGHPVPRNMKLVFAPNLRVDTDDPQFNEQMHNELLHIVADVVTPVLYFGLLTWKGKGRSPGKRLLRIRVVSIVHRHLSLWHSMERALGYGAAALEGGFGFVQFFIHPYRRCVQDRIAETIVVTERSYKLLETRALHPLMPNEGNAAATHIADEALPAEVLP